MQWRARDALVLKWVSLQLNGKLPLSPPAYAHSWTPGGTGRAAGYLLPTSGRDTVLCTGRISGLLPAYL
ncbi:hypothetical protein MTQ55_14210 [Escherichia coli]|uniref:hypothetical protein n=1 Tax=Escherichia coli TaxID=562 RepID=UPI000543F922|nr:hypothetical protein [Escherichia coli]EEU9451533.1 hypothetical protein [Escherichia coli]EFK8287041.1 hypothetical protein [Escherichia coli]EFK8681602.1 hypothetical protein [Escherichia coli]EHH4912844.1 hypothetical protein [Escherichia coli]EHJ6097492.1 hypothetical protein [Escherichia coli]